MLISCNEISNVWRVQPKGVLHIGAHEAEEAEDYARLDWGPVIWVEAQSKLAKKLKSRLKPGENTVFHAAAWDISGIEIELKITNNSQSTSLLEFGTHQQDYPDVKVTEIEKVVTTRIDLLLNDSFKFEFVNLDIQGAELRALKGMGNLLNQVNYIYTEINKQEVYVGCATIEEIENYLETAGFRKVSIRWIPKKGWGDALYVRRSHLDSNPISKIKSALFGMRFYFIYFYHEFGHKAKVFLKSKIPQRNLHRV